MCGIEAFILAFCLFLAGQGKIEGEGISEKNEGLERAGTKALKLQQQRRKRPGQRRQNASRPL